MNLYQRLAAVPPIRVAFATFLVTTVLLILSWQPVNVFNAEMPIPGKSEKSETKREVGFASAVNWSLNFMVVVPCTFLFMFTAFQSWPQAIRDLTRKRMLRKANMEICPANEPDVLKHWEGKMPQSQRVILFFIFIAFAVSIAEWWSYSGGPLIVHGQKIADKAEVDWSVKFAPEFTPEATGSERWMSAIFSLLAFVCLQAPFTSLLLVFFFFIYRCCEFIGWLATPSDDCVLVPSLAHSDDKRRGFEVFKTPAENILLTAGFAYGVFYLSRLWNVYLRKESTSIADFVTEDIKSGFNSGKNWLEKLKDLDLLKPEPWGDFGSTFVTAGAIVSLLLSLAVVLVLLRRAANRAKQNLRNHLENLPDNEKWETLNKADALSRLKEMDVWPLSYPRENVLILLAIFAVASMFYPRLGLFYVGLLVWVSAKKAMGLLTKGAESEKGSESGGGGGG